jgi:molybdate-binding protein/transcriptional regulator with XRE-family HTH domain
MATPSAVTNRVKDRRLQRGWSQVELADRAGVSRAAVSAIETDRLVPSVAAALGLARALGCRVEDLFGSADASAPEWAWEPRTASARFWTARVGGRTLRYPCEPTAAGVLPHDNAADPDPDHTLVLAGCDPAAGLLAAEYARATRFRLIPLPRSGRDALALLGRGLVHAAGAHFATTDDPDGNLREACAVAGPNHRLVRVARWESGVCVANGVKVRSVRTACGLKWVGREPGSAARQCQDELLPGRPPDRTAHDHRGVAEAVRGGWAEAGICHRFAAEEAGLGFLGVRTEAFDLCFPTAAENDPRIVALVRVVRSPVFRQLLGDLPGYDTADAGTVRGVG